MSKKKKKKTTQEGSDLPELDAPEITESDEELSMDEKNLDDLPEILEIEELGDEELKMVEEELEEPEPINEEMPDEPEVPEGVKMLMNGMTGHMTELINKLKGFEEEGKTDMIAAHRRKIRYRLFRIRDGGRIAKQHDKGLKAYIENQFESGMTWNTFTYEWDVAPLEPLTVIPRTITNYEWLDKGGQFQGDKKYPPAFTKQD